MSPPWLVTMALAMARPSPPPWIALSVALVARNSPVNRLGWIGGRNSDTGVGDDQHHVIVFGECS
jgi:hypothetical protein